MSNTRIECSEYPNFLLSPNGQTSAQTTIAIKKPIVKPRITTVVPIAKVKKMVPANKIQRFGGAK